MTILKLAAAVAVTTVLTGCVTPRPGAERVQLLSNVDLVKSCKFIGQQVVTSSSLPLDYVTSSVIAQIKEKALEAGGTHVLTTGPQVSSPGPVATLNGDIYRCA